ncbi:MAG: amino acid permease [Gemmatimonadetes bacterium]|nr:amino acid permease [Gemmatimonadota bacterium]
MRPNPVPEPLTPKIRTPMTEYARRLNLFDATMLVIGGIIGAGIFLNPAVVAQRVGTAGLTLAAWILGGLVAVAGALCFAELGAIKPQAGGGYVYLRDAFGGLPAFLYGWTELLVINSGGIAASAVTFATYTLSLLDRPPVSVPVLAIAAITVLTVVNYLGIKMGSVVQNIFTVLKLSALAGLIVAGLSASTSAPPVTIPSAAPLTAPHGVAATVAVLGTALIPVLFAYGGWQSTNFVAAELREPTRDLPRALILGVLGVVAVYVLANIAYLRVLGPAGLAASTAPASEVMRRVLGPAGGRLIALGVALSTFGFLNLAVLSAPRVYQAMAADGVFFGQAAALHPRFRVPAVALIVQGGWAILLLATKTYGQLLDYVVFGDWIFFGLVGATLFYYRRVGGSADWRVGGSAGRRVATAGKPHQLFRTPLYPWVPLFFVAAAAFTVISTVVSNPGNAALGAAIIAAGIPVFVWWRRKARGGQRVA